MISIIILELVPKIMLELEPLEQDIDIQIYSINQIEENLYNQTELIFNLGEPLSYFDQDQFNRMHSNEREFSKLLLSRGMMVFYEPKIEGIEQTPDFYVINQMSYTGNSQYYGKFVELTLCHRKDIENLNGYGSKKFARKKRQMEMFKSLGIPMVYIYREEQENIRRSLNLLGLF